MCVYLLIYVYDTPYVYITNYLVYNITKSKHRRSYFGFDTDSSVRYSMSWEKALFKKAYKNASSWVTTKSFFRVRHSTNTFMYLHYTYIHICSFNCSFRRISYSCGESLVGLASDISLGNKQKSLFVLWLWYFLVTWICYKIV